MVRKAHRRGFGHVRKLPSGRYQASYMGPDLHRHAAAWTFDAKIDAEAWLALENRLIALDAWTSPAQRSVPPSKALTLRRVRRDLAGRASPQAAHAISATARSSTATCCPAFGDMPLNVISPELVRTWHARFSTSKPTARSQAYSLLRTVLGTAVTDGLLPANPCHIRGAGNVKRVHKVEPATLEELEKITNAMPPRYQLMVLLAAWCALRFGELTELRRKDLDVTNGVVRIRRAVVRVKGEFIVGTPKTDAGTRDVAIPPHLMPAVREHLHKHTAPGRDSLLFPAKQGEQHGHRDALQGLLPGARGRWPPGPPLARPPPHRRRPRRPDRRHARRADGTSRPHHTRRRAPLPARRPGPRRRDRSSSVSPRPVNEAGGA